MWIPKKINFVCRIVDFGDEISSFKFDILYRSDLVITDGKSYSSYEDVISALSKSLNDLCELELNPSSHLIYNSVDI